MAELLELKGSFYDIGKQLGRKKQKEIRVVLEEFRASALYDKISCCMTTNEGHAVFEQFLETCKLYCGDYMDELRGVAHGAEMSFDELFTLNIDAEFLAHFFETPDASRGIKYELLYSGCTNLSLDNGTETYLLHTEDISPATKDLGVMLSVEITDEHGNLREKWTDYVVPGVLMGSKMSFNNHGVMAAGNNIYQKGVNRRGIRMATGYSWQYLTKVTNDSGEVHVSNTYIEIAGTPDGNIVVEYHPGTLYHHCNIFQHLCYECHPEESSIHRAAVIGQYILRGDVTTKDDLLEIASNQQDAAFPVFRTGQPPDYLATGATGVFEAVKGTLTIYTDKPNQAAPVHVFQIET